jgi:DNA adenine methylase
MKPPFAYYGGKQRIASKIVPLLPKHTVYVEPFCGSATILFAKPWPNVTNTHHYREVINDTNDEVINFFHQLRDNPDELIRICSLTPHARNEHKNSKITENKSDVERARRFYTNIQQSFSNEMNAGWRTGIFGRNEPITLINKNKRLYDVAERIIQVYIEHKDALSVIKQWDSPQTLFYCDPPYPGTDQGHYSGYSYDNFLALTNALNECQGSFLLSCYGFDAPEHWERFEFKATCSASGKGQAGPGRDKTKAATNLGNRKRTEVVYRVIRGDNARPEIKKLYQLGLFDCFEGS